MLLGEKIILKPAEHQVAVELFLKQHSLLHASEMCHSPIATLEDELVTNLREETCRNYPVSVPSHVPDMVELEEVKREDVKSFIPYVLGNMEYDKEKETIHENLRLFTMLQIIGYIETSVELAL